MAMMGSNNWEGPDHGLHLGGPDDEFQQFLDMNGMGNMADGLHFDFTDFQNTNGGHIPQSQSRESIDTTMGGTDNGNMMPRLDNGIQGQMHNVTTSTPLSSIPASLMPPPTPSEAMAEIDAQIQYLQQQRIQQAQRHMEEQQAAFFVRQQQQSRMVPPTPQSLELQAGTQFYSPHDQNRQAMYDRYSQLKEQHQELSFTPLVSPAVTPLESQFAIDTQFTVPGAYFSPLTSPALHAQNDANAGFDQRLSSTNSPVDMELESLPGPAAPTSGEVVKKLRKSTTTKTRKSTVKSSPITKAQRRKTLTTPIMKSQQALNQVVEDLESRDQQMSQLPPPAPQSSHATAFGGTTDSENGSVSPQNLSDMPPPPVPKSKSARPSPYMGPQNGAAAHNLATLPGHPSPATPASLMKLPSPKANKSSSRATSQEPAPNEHIEMFELPESVNSTFQKPNPRPIETRSQTQSPALSPMSTKTPGAHPALSPATFAKPPAPGSATASPQLTPGPPSGSLRKTPQMLPRGSKKRGSINSVHVSPALRPKISPNIKPLLPGGTTAEDTASLLLASKSNYQNILEGNNVPGVSYPSELSTNLTSKRTSHKIAEQGRRNRINSALQEIATLLPAVPPKDSEGEGSDGKKEGKNGANSVPNSKASTVELAIEYIKQLKQEVEEANKRAEEAEKKLAMQA